MCGTPADRQVDRERGEGSEKEGESHTRRRQRLDRHKTLTQQRKRTSHTQSVPSDVRSLVTRLGRSMLATRKTPAYAHTHALSTYLREGHGLKEPL